MMPIRRHLPALAFASVLSPQAAFLVSSSARRLRSDGAGAGQYKQYRDFESSSDDELDLVGQQASTEFERFRGCSKKDPQSPSTTATFDFETAVFLEMQGQENVLLRGGGSDDNTDLNNTSDRLAKQQQTEEKNEHNATDRDVFEGLVDIEPLDEEEDVVNAVRTSFEQEDVDVLALEEDVDVLALEPEVVTPRAVFPGRGDDTAGPEASVWDNGRFPHRGLLYESLGNEGVKCVNLRGLAEFGRYDPEKRGDDASMTGEEKTENLQMEEQDAQWEAKAVEDIGLLMEGGGGANLPLIPHHQLPRKPLQLKKPRRGPTKHRNRIAENNKAFEQAEKHRIASALLHLDLVQRCGEDEEKLEQYDRVVAEPIMRMHADFKADTIDKMKNLIEKKELARGTEAWSGSTTMEDTGVMMDNGPEGRYTKWFRDVPGKEGPPCPRYKTWKAARARLYMVKDKIKEDLEDAMAARILEREQKLRSFLENECGARGSSSEELVVPDDHDQRSEAEVEAALERLRPLRGDGLGKLLIPAIDWEALGRRATAFRNGERGGEVKRVFADAFYAKFDPRKNPYGNGIFDEADARQKSMRKARGTGERNTHPEGEEDASCGKLWGGEEDAPWSNNFTGGHGLFAENKSKSFVVKKKTNFGKVGALSAGGISQKAKKRLIDAHAHDFEALEPVAGENPLRIKVILTKK